MDGAVITAVPRALGGEREVLRETAEAMEGSSCSSASWNSGGRRLVLRRRTVFRVEDEYVDTLRQKFEIGVHRVRTTEGKSMDHGLVAETHQDCRNLLGDVAAAADSGEQIGQPGGD